MTALLVWCALSCLSAYGWYRLKERRSEAMLRDLKAWNDDVERVINEMERITREREGVMRALDRSRLRQHSWKHN